MKGSQAMPSLTYASNPGIAGLAWHNDHPKFGEAFEFQAALDHPIKTHEAAHVHPLV